MIIPFNDAVFIDHSAFLAFLGFEEYKDYHDIANKWFTKFFQGDFNKKYDLLITTDYVVNYVANKLYETSTTYDNIISFIQNLIRSSSIKIINVHEDGFSHACRNINTYYSIFKFNFSFTDITTLYVLKSTIIKAILTFNPLFHRLDYLIHQDFNPEMDLKDGKEAKLFYDAIPNDLFLEEKEKPFFIYNKSVNPLDAIILFEIELTLDWAIESIEVDKDYFVSKIKFKYEYDGNPSSKHLKNLPIRLKKLKMLRRIDLSNNSINDNDLELFEDLISVIHLQELDLSNNNLTKIPEVLKILQNQSCKIII